MHQPAIGNLPFGALAKDALQIGNWIGRIGERIGPLLLEMRMNDLPDNCVSQIFFALEVMKQRAFGRARPIYDAIEATALESVFVKFLKRGLQDFSARVFWRSGGGRFHSSTTIQTSRYVSTINFGFFTPLRRRWRFAIGFDFVVRVMVFSSIDISLPDFFLAFARITSMVLKCRLPVFRTSIQAIANTLTSFGNCRMTARI